MALDARLQALLESALRIIGDRDVADLIAQLRSRAIIGPEQIPESEVLAKAALEKMRSGQPPTPEETAALAVVIRIIRPVPLIRGGKIPALPHDPKHDLHGPGVYARWNTFRTIADPFVQSVGRIERKNGEHVATGFLVRDGVLATNRHVLAQLTFGTEVLLPSEPARICFGREDGVAVKASDIVEITGVVGVHPRVDLALLRVPKQERPPLLLSQETLLTGAPVAVIGYPAEDNQNPAFLRPVFNGIFSRKRICAGELLDGGWDSAVYHDCSTTQGSSGSPVFSLESGQVVAIHYGGRFMYRNEAAPYAAWHDFLTSQAA
ncbi:MAG TPA: serine protease [Lysobacter sp.]